MNELQHQGAELRNKAKELALRILRAHPDAQKNGKGVKQSEVFHLSGLNWGEKRKATSSHQQYWVVALLRELEEEGLVEQIEDRGPWRLR
ncbi:hypothetical protein NOH08_20725 [Escherichia coli]|uniref:hypothetical protein n=1 Tax=Escherichia coli TaxID=562 RepID=UPI001324705E|nr:hypothetical protein [Escherichia coli]EFB1310202.1 hypothetical protein [Escherichia coli]EFJ8724056.1 hypothetical protein [Escherichia coli]EHE8728098.1 hypothetical protein [Escherichia coli]EIH4386716.1 hypothetical protein [Escherichia coli]EJE8387854.1 hypothetical protein [Escherichia coli]